MEDPTYHSILGRARQGDHEFEASFDYSVISELVHIL